MDKKCGDCFHADVCEEADTLVGFGRENPAYCGMFLDNADVVEAGTMREFAADVAYQFGCYGQYNGRLHINNGGLSTLEQAFDILGWENPHPVPEFECEIEGCHEHATCGTQTTVGYKRMCGKHFYNYYAKMDGDGNG